MVGLDKGTYGTASSLTRYGVAARAEGLGCVLTTLLCAREKLYLSYGIGLYEPINVITARFYLKARLWLEVVSRLENSVDLYYSWDID